MLCRDQRESYAEINTHTWPLSKASFSYARKRGIFPWYCSEYCIKVPETPAPLLTDPMAPTPPPQPVASVLCSKGPTPWITQMTVGELFPVAVGWGSASLASLWATGLGAPASPLPVTVLPVTRCQAAPHAVSQQIRLRRCLHAVCVISAGCG